MPTYHYKCDHCSNSFDKVLRLRDHASFVTCDHCGQLAQQRLTAPMVAFDYPEYVSPATGKLIRGKRQHIEDLKSSGCRILEPGETEAFIKNKPKRQDALFERLADEVVSEVAPYIPE